MAKKTFAVDSCKPIIRVSKTGAIIVTQACKISGSGAVVMVSEDSIRGVTGNPSVTEAKELATAIQEGSSASEVLTGKYKPMTI